MNPFNRELTCTMRSSLWFDPAAY